MRVLKTIPLVVLSGFILLFASGRAAAHHQKPCAIPHGWRLVARDRYAVVVERRSSYEYCSRRVGRFRAVAGFFPAPAITNVVRLAGRYIAVEQASQIGAEFWLQDTRSGASVSSGNFNYGATDISPPPGHPPLVLSRNGIAAWIVAIGPVSPGDTPHIELGALSFAGPPYFVNATSPTDGPWPGTEFGNLALYDCAAGCPSNAVIVAWTDNGQQRYAQITG